MMQIFHPDFRLRHNHIISINQSFNQLIRMNQNRIYSIIIPIIGIEEIRTIRNVRNS